MNITDQNKNRSKNKIPDDMEMLIEMKSMGLIYSVPNWNYDDSYIINYAQQRNAYVITNDRYNDHIQK